MLLLEKEFTATNTDMLASTDLDSPPYNGVMIIYCASTVNTATLEAPQPDHQPGMTMLLRKRTDGIPNITDDPPVIIPVVKGKRPTLVLGGTTGTVHLTVIYKPSI